MPLSLDPEIAEALARWPGSPRRRVEVGTRDRIGRDEDLACAATLSRAGVPVEFHLHPGAPHEFDSIGLTSDVARRAVADRVRVLRSR